MNRKHLGVMYILLAALLFSFMNMFVRLAGPVPVFQKTVIRNAVATVFAFIVLLREKPYIELNLNKGDWGVLLIRSILGTMGIICNFYAVDHMLLADASILAKLSPFFALIMGALILKEKVAPFQIGTVAIAFLGALLVIKPGAGIIAAPALAGITGGFIAGITHTMIRLAGKRGVPGIFIVFFFSAFAAVCVLPLAIITYEPMALKQVLFMVCAGLSAAGAQCCLTLAYINAPAKEISVFDYSQIIFMAVIGYFLFDQIPDMYSWIGYVIILGTAVANYLFTREQDKKLSAENRKKKLAS